jgi:hypothetical protein
MSSFRIRRPSPAMVVALIALVVAMAGTGYAAMKLPKSSVGAKQLKKNAVTGAKVKKNAITGAKVKDGSLSGADIDVGSLGTVPSANVANTLPPLEPVHVVGDPDEPPFLNGASNLTGKGFGFRPAGFYKDHDGIVHLQGVLDTGEGGTFGEAFALPAGFRPEPGTLLYGIVLCLPTTSSCHLDDDGDEQEYQRIVIGGGGASIGGNDASGWVMLAADETVSLDGIAFRAGS